jgi:hypothetical protein
VESTTPYQSVRCVISPIILPLILLVLHVVWVLLIASTAHKMDLEEQNVSTVPPTTLLVMSIPVHFVVLEYLTA